MKTADTGIGD